MAKIADLIIMPNILLIRPNLSIKMPADGHIFIIFVEIVIDNSSLKLLVVIA